VFEADAVVIAFGFNASPAPWFAEQGIEIDDWGLVKASENSEFPFQTSHPRVFAAGDMVRGADLVVTAIADARKAGEGIVRLLARERPDELRASGS
jgi:glutamate synthase (NADPH/NADH) small chain